MTDPQSQSDNLASIHRANSGRSFPARFLHEKFSQASPGGGGLRHAQAVLVDSRPQRRPLMMIKLAIALAIVLTVAAFAAWAFPPG